jgi:hypothetical protein
MKDKFRKKATDIIAKFASDFGVCIYKQRLSSSIYDPISGQSLPGFNDIPVLIAFDKVEDKAFDKIYHTAAYRQAFISGESLGITPSKGDIIQSFDSKNFLVEEYTSDMYEALYILVVKEINE